MKGFKYILTYAYTTFYGLFGVIPVFTNTGITKLNRRLCKVFCMSAQLLLYPMLPKSRQATVEKFAAHSSTTYQ